MNERIRQLAIEAGMIVGDAGEFDMAKFMPKEVKFAKLIVRECCDIVHRKTDESIRVVMAIEQHFGVEE